MLFSSYQLKMVEVEFSSSFISQCHTHILLATNEFPHFPLQKFLYLQIFKQCVEFLLSPMRKETIASHARISKSRDKNDFYLSLRCSSVRIL